MAPVRWSQGPFRITGLGGRNPTYYLFCGHRYIGRGASVEALQVRASTLDPEEVTKARQTPSPRASVQATSARRPPPRLNGTFIMRDDDQPDIPATEEEGKVPAAKKKTSPRKKAAEPKAKKVKAVANGRLSNEATFRVDLSKSDRKPQSKGFKHLQNLKANEGKTLAELRKREWFERYRLGRDIECGALTIVQPKE